MDGKIMFGRAFDRCASLFEKANFEGLSYCVYTPQLSEDEKVPLVLFFARRGGARRGQ